MGWLAVSQRPTTYRAYQWDGSSAAEQNIADAFTMGVRKIFIDRQGGTYDQTVVSVIGGDLTVSVEWTDSSSNPQTNNITLPAGSFYVTGVGLYGEALSLSDFLARFAVTSQLGGEDGE